MPWGAVTLRPGVDTQRTLSLNEAGVSNSQLIRYKEGLIQTYGGWVNYMSGIIASTTRELHPWQDINGFKYLAVGGTQQLSIVSDATRFQQNFTPQTTTTNPAPNFSITASSNIVTVVDPNANVSIYNTVYFDTPIALGGTFLNGAYAIVTALSSTTYTIISSGNATGTVTSSGILPTFTTGAGSQTITVTLPNNNFQAIPGLFQQFIAPTTVGSSQPIIVQGKYQISSVIDSTSFKMNAVVQASTSATATMNGGNAQLVYYITLGPTVVGSGFGAGGFGSGGWGTGSNQSGVSGTPITTTDWTMDNWGEVLLACPKDGPIYAWSPDLGFQTAQVINQAPFFNGGIFIAMPQQILVAWRSVQATGVQDNLIVRWSNQSDYTNWAVNNQTTAGSFHIPTGSYIIGGMQLPQFAMISTDLDVWSMTYVGGVVIFNFNRIGSGCGWVGPHACGVLGGNPFWMANNNFFTLSGGAVLPLPCSVWDQVFQNLNIANQSKCRVAVNSAFNEISWFYPSAGSTENDSYVKVHIEGQEYEWDFGDLSRTAWTDVSILGMPIGVDPTGQLSQHEIGTSITGVGLPSFQTGWWTITEGEDIPFIDLIIPDFIWGTKSTPPTASINITFYGVNYPGDTPTQYGPYTVTMATEFINVRIRNRLMSVFVQSQQNSEFWRLGKIRFRFATSGRR